MKDVTKNFLITVAIVFTLLCTTFISAYFVSNAVCMAQTEDFESRFEILTDCQVKVEGKWVQWDNYIINREDQGGRDE